MNFICLILGSPCHPWLFIEEAATKEVEKDFNSVYSRLVLCKTYRLDEDGKVLTPEEVSIFFNSLRLHYYSIIYRDVDSKSPVVFFYMGFSTF